MIQDEYSSERRTLERWGKQSSTVGCYWARPKTAHQALTNFSLGGGVAVVLGKLSVQGALLIWIIQKNFNGSNTDGSFTTAVLNNSCRFGIL